MKKLEDFELLGRYARGEVEIDLVECAEILLSGDGINAFFARIVLALNDHGDKLGAWTRFSAHLLRTYGADWRAWNRLDRERSLKCNQRGCMELAVGGLCDQCLTKGL